MLQKTRVAAAGLLILFLAGCGSSGNSQGASESPTPQVTASAPASAPATPSTVPSSAVPAPAQGTTITTGNSDFGPILFDSRNQAIYIWEVETTSTPECYDDCAQAWPPVLTEGAPTATGAALPNLLGTTTRTDGTTQVTYNGHPLYYYVDEGPGEVKCHNVATHGGLWWVVQPNGNPAPAGV